MGPKAGLEGGRVVFSGKINNLKKNKSSITAKYLFGEESINIPSKRRKFNTCFISVGIIFIKWF